MATKDLSSFKIEGIITAPFTPMKENGDLNLETIDRYIDHILDYGISNVFVNGTTGEGLLLTIEERKQAAEAWVKASKERLKCVIVHVGGGNQKESIELARHAEQIGACAIAALVPTFFKPSSEEVVVDYIKSIAAAAPSLPFYYYCINFMTGTYLNNAKVCQLAKDAIPTFRGMKHSSKEIPSMQACEMVDKNLQVVIGTDEQYLAALAIGVEFSVSNSFMCVLMNRVRDAFKAGDMESARRYQEQALVVNEIRNKYGDGQAISKTILKLIGVDVGPTRLPLEMPSCEDVHNLRKDLQDAGFFKWSKPTKEESAKWLGEFN